MKRKNKKQIDPQEFFKQNPPATDFDGVIADTRTNVVKIFNKMFNTNYSPGNIKKYDQVYCWAKKKGLSDKDAIEVENDLWYNPDILFLSDPVPGAIEFTRWFSEKNILLPIFSSRRDKKEVSPKRFKNIHEATIEWTKFHLPWIKPKDVYIKEVDDEHTANFKPNKISEFGRRIFFEDWPNHADEILKETPKNVAVVLLSNSDEIDHLYNKKRLIRLAGKNGKLPDMFQICKLFNIPLNL